MGTNVIFTLTGPDRVGIVEDVTRAFLDLNGNVGTSRMARLSGEFAMLMSVTLPGAVGPEVEAAFSELANEGYRVTIAEARTDPSQAHADWVAYSVAVTGADHEGIAYEIAAGLSRAGISIESMETSTTEAAVSGTPLFMMQAEVVVPPTLDEATWIAELDEAGRAAGVDIEVLAQG